MTASKPAHWTAQDIPDQRGRTAVITGANTGIGFETAKALALRGAAVVLAVRDTDKGKRAAEEIALAAPTASVRVQRLDLSSLASVRDAAGELRDAYARIDTLINNAGVMYTPQATTANGYELQFGTNHLGHFALTGLLLDRLPASPASRVVTVSSAGHRMGGPVDLDDLDWRRRPYDRTAAYGHSKLANLLFTYELARRLPADGPLAVAAHPGAPTPPVPGARWRTRPPSPARPSRRSGRCSSSPREGRTARAARRDRPWGARWRVLRPPRIPAEQGAPQGGPLQPAVVRHVAATPAVGAVAGHDRCRVSRVAPRERRGETNRRPPCAARGPAATVTSEGRAEDACAHFPCRSAGEPSPSGEVELPFPRPRHERAPFRGREDQGRAFRAAAVAHRDESLDKGDLDIPRPRLLECQSASLRSSSGLSQPASGCCWMVLSATSVLLPIRRPRPA